MLNMDESTNTPVEKKWEKVIDKESVAGWEKMPLPEKIFSREVYSSDRPEHSLVSRRDIKGEGVIAAYCLDGVLREEECNFLIDATESLGFSFWNEEQETNREFRSAYTIEVTHPELADIIWGRVKGAVDQEIEISEDDEKWEAGLEGVWVADTVYSKLLFARYTDGGHFGPHSDGSVAIDFNYRTLFSFTIFLNYLEEGGETAIILNTQSENSIPRDNYGRYVADSAYICEAVKPCVGRLVCFYQSQMHEGRPVGSGNKKYIIRSDFLYRRKDPILTSPVDKEAFNLWQKAQLTAETGDTQEAMLLFRKCFKLSPLLQQMLRM